MVSGVTCSTIATTERTQMGIKRLSSYSMGITVRSISDITDGLRLLMIGKIGKSTLQRMTSKNTLKTLLGKSYLCKTAGYIILITTKFSTQKHLMEWFISEERLTKAEQQKRQLLVSYLSVLDLNKLCLYQP